MITKSRTLNTPLIQSPFLFVLLWSIRQNGLIPSRISSEDRKPFRHTLQLPTKSLPSQHNQRHRETRTDSKSKRDKNWNATHLTSLDHKAKQISYFLSPCYKLRVGLCLAKYCKSRLVPPLRELPLQLKRRTFPNITSRSPSATRRDSLWSPLAAAVLRRSHMQATILTPFTLHI
jgi:hypothetical protein